MRKGDCGLRIEAFLEKRMAEEKTINAWMQMQMLSYDEERRSILLAFPIQKWQLNPMGHLHGGMISTAMDIAMGCVAYVFSNVIFTPTAQLSINFVRPVLDGDSLYVEGICDKMGSRLAQVRGIARNKNGEVVATANGTYVINTK